MTFANGGGIANDAHLPLDLPVFPSWRILAVAWRLSMQEVPSMASDTGGHVMPLGIKQPEPAVHLYRGAPIIRSWSKYQQTVKEWALCGVRAPRKGDIRDLRATEDAGVVSCTFCIQLMQTSPMALAKSGYPSEAA